MFQIAATNKGQAIDSSSASSQFVTRLIAISFKLVNFFSMQEDEAKVRVNYVLTCVDV